MGARQGCLVADELPDPLAGNAGLAVSGHAVHHICRLPAVLVSITERGHQPRGGRFKMDAGQRRRGRLSNTARSTSSESCGRDRVADAYMAAFWIRAHACTSASVRVIPGPAGVRSDAACRTRSARVLRPAVSGPRYCSARAASELRSA